MVRNRTTLALGVAAIAGVVLLSMRKDSPHAVKVGLPPPRDLDRDGLYEDLDGDGAVTTADANILLEALVGLNDYILKNPKWWDFNKDGVLSIGDVVIFLAKYGL